MKYFTDVIEFNKEMTSLEKILQIKGFVMESDHAYAYTMQYDEAFADVKEWLINNGYKGELKHLGAFEVVAVYGLYDSNKIDYNDMLEKLLNEAKSQI